jgi:hypothetical protein
MGAVSGLVAEAIRSKMLIEAATPRLRLRRLREHLGLNRSEVARDLNLAERTLIRHELGTTPLRWRHVRMYAKYYGVAPHEIAAPQKIGDSGVIEDALDLLASSLMESGFEIGELIEERRRGRQ